MSAKYRKKKKTPPSRSGGPVSGSLRDHTTVIDLFLQKHPHADLWLSGILPVFGLLIIFACVGIYPFGEKTVANVDMLQQYIPFYASLKEAVLGGHGMGYSQSLGMGGSFWALFGYYLANPFAWLSLIVPNDRLTDYMALQELVKVGLAGSAFAYYYRNKFGRCDLTVPLLSVCYAMSGFFLTHLSTIIWSDCLVLLPLIVWGLEELLRGRNPQLYVICLSLAGICNYYIAMIIGGYLVLYAAGFLFMERKTYERGVIPRKCAMFAVSSLLSIGTAAFVIIPSALALGEYARGSEEASARFWAANPLCVLSQLLCGADSRVLDESSLPLVYCSVLAVMCLPLFLVSKKLPAGVKITYGGLTGFIALSLSVGGLNYLWHGAHIPNRLPFRFAFLLVFTLLTMAGYVLDSIDSVSSNCFVYVLFGMMAVVAALFFAGGMKNAAMLVGTLILAALYTVIFFLRSERKLASSAALAMALLAVFTELTVGGIGSWRSLSEESQFTPREDYMNYCQAIESAANVTEEKAVSESDISHVCRVGTLLGKTFNDNAMLGRSGMSYFSSTNNGHLMRLLHRIGYDSDGIAAYFYKSFTPLMDSALNTEYVVYAEDVGDPPYLQKISDVGGCFVYRNTLALPRAFAVESRLLEWDTTQENPFSVQNDFVRKAVSDSDLTVYEPLRLSPDQSQTDGSSYVNGAVDISAGGRLSLTAAVKKRRHIYLYADCANASEMVVSVGERQYRLSESDAYLTDLGWQEPGELLAVTVTADQPVSGVVFAAALDEAALERSMEALSQSPAVFTQYGDNRISFVVKADKKQILFTSIPYEKGWKATVNGQPAEILPIGGGLIGIPLDEEINAVELHYSVRGLTAGIIVTLLSIAIAVWLLYGRRMAAMPAKLHGKPINLL